MKLTLGRRQNGMHCNVSSVSSVSGSTVTGNSVDAYTGNSAHAYAHSYSYSRNHPPTTIVRFVHLSSVCVCMVTRVVWKNDDRPSSVGTSYVVRLRPVPV
jgi:hypothetical protein